MLKKRSWFQSLKMSYSLFSYYEEMNCQYHGYGPTRRWLNMLTRIPSWIIMEVTYSCIRRVCKIFGHQWYEVNMGTEENPMPMDCCVRCLRPRGVIDAEEKRGNDAKGN